VFILYVPAFICYESFSQNDEKEQCFYRVEEIRLRTNMEDICLYVLFYLLLSVVICFVFRSSLARSYTPSVLTLPTGHISSYSSSWGKPNTLQWAQLPITAAEYTAQQNALHEKYFPESRPLPGVEKLLTDLATAVLHNTSPNPQKQPIHVALATSSHAPKFKLKTTHLQDLFKIFPENRRVLGDDPRIPKGKGKPAPDIYLLALKTINESLLEGEPEIKPSECLVFEDAVPGVEAGRRAGMRVVWVPAPGLADLHKGAEEKVLAGRTGEGDSLHGPNGFGEVGDGWGVQLGSLEDFQWEYWGIVVGGK
jgi:pseudouridine 5'-phosphatase